MRACRPLSGGRGPAGTAGPAAVRIAGAQTDVDAVLEAAADRLEGRRPRQTRPQQTCFSPSWVVKHPPNRVTGARAKDRRLGGGGRVSIWTLAA